MARTKGATNKSRDYLPYYAKLPTDERIKFLASVIVDRLQADLKDGGKLLKRIERHSGGNTRLSA